MKRQPSHCKLFEGTHPLSPLQPTHPFPLPPATAGRGFIPAQEGGYTILEALLALVVISILAFPVFKLLNTEKTVSTSARDQATAYFLASSEIERIRSMPFAGLQDRDSLADLNGKQYRLVRKVRGRFAEFGSTQDSLENTLQEFSVEVFLKDKRLSRMAVLLGALEKDTTR